MVGDLVLLIAVAAPVLACVYLGALALLSGDLPPPPPDRAVRCDVLVPAHDEESGIAATVQSLKQLDYPTDRFRVVVIADNCSDRTAERARAAGAIVWERFDDGRRGKGYALELGFARSRAEGSADAVVVVDADTVVTPNLLSAFAARVRAGAEAVQAHYGVRNPDASWRTRLMAVALALFHRVRSRARERLSLSCGLRGNGMAFTHALLRRVPHRAFSEVEDLEYGIQLGEAGVRVEYADEAEVLGEMPSTGAPAKSQRRRWELGRRAIARSHLARLLWRGLRGDAVCLDLALDLVVPPLGTLAISLFLAGVGAVALGSFEQRVPAASWAIAVGALCFAAYVVRGWQLSRSGTRGLVALLAAPAYVVWKLAVKLRPSTRRGEWIRTARESGPGTV